MDSMLAALSNRIREFLQSRDPSLVLDPAALEEAARLREAVRPPDGNLRSIPVDVITVLAYLHLARYQVLPDGQDQNDLNIALSHFRLLMDRAPEQSPPSYSRRFRVRPVPGG